MIQCRNKMNAEDEVTVHYLFLGVRQDAMGV